MGTLFTGLGAAAALADTDIIPVHQGGARAVGLTGAQLLTYVGTTYVPLAGGATMTGALTLPAGSQGSPTLDFTGSGIFKNYANTLSISAGGAERLLVTADAVHSTAPLLSVYPDSSALAFGAASDIKLYRDAAATLAQRNGAVAQRMHIYGTADGSPGSNYQRLVLSANGTTGVTIAAEGLGTPGANQNITLKAGGTGSIKFNLNGSDSAYFDYIGNLVLKALYSTSLYLPSTALSGWTSGSLGASIDIALMRNAAGVVEVTNGTANTYRDLKLRNLIQTEYSQLTEMTAPSAPATNSVRIYAEDNGAGKTRLMALFATGSAVQLGIEP